MVKAVNQKVIDNEYPKKTFCEFCGEELEYDKEDENIGIFGHNVIKCPCCGGDVIVGEGRVLPPTFPTTFYPFGQGKDAVHLSDKEIQEHVHTVTQNLKKIGVGEYTSSGTGNVMVFGFKYEDEDIIHVSKDYYEDSIFKE